VPPLPATSTLLKSGSQEFGRMDFDLSLSDVFLMNNVRL
jgi:hypothetical protein